MKKSSGATLDAVRKLLRARISARGETLNEVSKAIGKNHAYLQQYFERGIPKVLSYKTAVSLAEHLKIDLWQILDVSKDKKYSQFVVFSEDEKNIVYRYRKFSRKSQATIQRFLKSCE